MNRERIAHAITVLQSVPAHKFDLHSWATVSKEEYATLGSGSVVRINGCGMSACACGWVASSQAAIDAGFHMVLDSISPDDDGNYEVCLQYADRRGWEAAEAYFDINYSLSNTLFSSERYADSNDLAAVIERLQFALEHGADAAVAKWGEE